MADNQTAIEPINPQRHQRRTQRDDVDDEIYHHRIVEHRTWRDIGQRVGLAPSTVRERFTKYCQRITPADAASLRQEESDQLDQLRATAHDLAAVAAQLEDPDLILKCVREMHAISRTRIQLWGLETTSHTPPDIDHLNDLINAYMTGHNDAAAQQQEPTP